jgi:sec-independent protein translocase protein TatC
LSFNPRELIGGAQGGAEPEELQRMGFFQHLEELRRRLIVSLLAVFIGFLASWYFAPAIFDFLSVPIRRALPPGQKLSYTTLTEPFLMYFRVALLAGTLLAAPVVLWQVWLFISPALYRREKKYVVPFVTFGALFFFSGCAFAYYEAFPLVVGFLVKVGEPFSASCPRSGS